MPPDPVHRPTTQAALTLAALGIVFGDIGTSPLYSLQTVFSIDHNSVAPTALDVTGVLSLVFWSVTLIVSVKYVALVMRADNEGEGGILALLARLLRHLTTHRRQKVIVLLGIIGAGLFFGDSVITPAISVMSAVEGLSVVNPGAEQLVLPISVAILTVLFAVQRFGTARVGGAFGPVMILWFATLAAMGIPHILAYPQVLASLSPTYAAAFIIQRPGIAFIAMGAVVLTITGAEALYADMGHFGRRPIRRAWFAVVFPALMLNYLGQGAMILQDPSTSAQPFFRMLPPALVVPVVLLATFATVIASQAVISGAFSVAQQALNLGLIPRIAIRHTSRVEGGQIFVPTINTLLFAGVLVLVVGFGSSAALANAYGLAVTGTLLLTTVLFCGVARLIWRWKMWRLILVLVVIGGLELCYFGASITKLFMGGWLPIAIAMIVVAVMTTWRWGTARVRARRRVVEGNLGRWLEGLPKAGITRISGQSIFLHSDSDTVPFALKDMLQIYPALHEQVAIVTINVRNVPHVKHVERITLRDLGESGSGIVAIRIDLGFNDSTAVAHNLQWSYGMSQEFEFEANDARYFLSLLDVRANDGPRLTRWRKRLYAWLSRNAGSRVEAFGVPRDRTVILGNRLYF
ncbi:MAG: potassium transporter Kup [Arachnia sp.]